MKKPFKTTVVFGSEAANRFSEGCTNKRTLRKYGRVQTFRFATQAELDAFEMGIEETIGEQGAAYFNTEEPIRYD